MSLLFLRPMAPPRASTVKHFLGIAKVSTTSIPSTPLQSSPSTIPSSSTAPTKAYQVQRTTSNNLPVYLLTLQGGNKKLTKIRRIEGDLSQMKADLLKVLQVDDKEVVINRLTQHMIIKGHKKSEVLKFLEDNKF